MLCTNCGSKINKNDNFCVSCGSKIVRPKDEVKKINNLPTSKANNSFKTVSIILGIISIITCFTIIISLPLAIIGLILAFKARETDRNFIAGIILNIVGIIAIIAFTGLLFIDLSTENKLNEEWCCNSNGYSNLCELKIDLENNYTYTISDQFETFETPGKWNYDWQGETSKGDKFKLTLDDNTYTTYVKKDKMRIYISDTSNRPLMYCTKEKES